MRLIARLSIAAVFSLLFILVHGRPNPSNFRVPRGLKQATRSEVAARLAGGPDKTHAAKRQGTSPLPPSDYACGEIAGGGDFGCEYTVFCAAKLTGSAPVDTSTQLTFSACLAACDSNEECFMISYQFSTHQCIQYQDNGDETLGSNSDYESVALVSGISCGRT